MLANLAVGVIGQVVSLFGQRGKEKSEALKARVESMKRSGTDEIITACWFSPLVVMWFDAERARVWIDTAFNTSPEYTALLIGITAAVFGLGKINGRVEK